MATKSNVKTETVAQLERRIRKIVTHGEIDRILSSAVENDIHRSLSEAAV